MAKKSGERSRRTPRTAPRPTSDLGGISTADLAREMARRQGALSKLQRRRESLVAQIAEIDQELGQYGAAVARGGGSGRRPRNGMRLADALVEVLKNKTMSVTEAAEAVQLAGYQTSSANFRTIVNQTLIKDDRFENVERGKYRAK